MLLPALSRARERARAAVCINNLKQLGLSVTLYATDYDGWAPPTALFQRVLERYLPNYKQIFDCPTRKGDPYTSRTFTDLTYYPGDYGYNSLLNNPGSGIKPPRVDKVKKASEVLMFCDIKGAAATIEPNVIWTERTYSEPVSVFSFSNRHSGGGNIVWCDGHTEWLSWNQFRHLVTKIVGAWNTGYRFLAPWNYND
ncbi:MAG: DUF1559 domain-containing protein [bacterium]|nr:DUF1559 domain-containing protein [bacterium]